MGAGSIRAIVVMGVSGAGKSTVGRALAEQLGWRFIEGDDFHSALNRAKLRRGEPLDDEDRAPWLAALNAELRGAAAQHSPAVLACSALKATYRRQLIKDLHGVAFVYLRGSPTTLRTRLQSRHGHFATPDLLDSQLATLEPPAPGEATPISIDQPVPHAVAEIIDTLGLAPQGQRRQG